jgi:hypothetical protein
MSNQIRVAMCGVGNMGKEMVRVIAKKKSLTLVGAVDNNPELIGKDVGTASGTKHVGVTIRDDLGAVLEQVKPDIVMIATQKDENVIFKMANTCVRAKANVLSLSAIFYPWVDYPELSKELDAEAKKYGVTAIGDGLNPGFIMDLIPIIFTGVCAEVRKITVHRTLDMTPYGLEVIKHIGAGKSVEEFKAKALTKELQLHGGYKQSMAMIADSLGWKLENVIEEAEPVIAKQYRKSDYCEIKPGMASGYIHSCYGFMNGHKVVELKLVGVVKPELDDLTLGDWILIEGEPDIDLFIKRELAQKGGLAGAAHPVNLIPLIVAAKPGLICVKDLPPAPAIL